MKYRFYRYLNALHYLAYVCGCSVSRLSVKVIADTLQQSGFLLKPEAEVGERG